MLINIDYREKDLRYEFALLEKSAEFNKYNEEIKITSSNLAIGDIIIANDDKEVVIIERKTLQDLATSIKDGRYLEQSFRLSNCSMHNHNIIYLIEGDLNKYKPSSRGQLITKKSLLSAFVSLSYFKGFSLLRTQSVSESAEYIVQMARKLAKDTGKPSFYEKPEGSGNQKYCEVTKRVKKDNITSENIGEIMLTQIPGISSTSAIAIMNKYSTIQYLIKCLENNGREEDLSDIITQTKTGKSRHLTKTVINNIHKYLGQKM